VLFGAENLQEMNMNMPRNDKTLSKSDISAWLSIWLSRELEMPSGEIEVERSLMDYGLSSIVATMLVGDLEDHLGLQLPVTLAWDYPTIKEMSSYLHEASSSQTPTAVGAAPSEDDLPTDLENLSDEEVDALLARLGSSD
jgi:acyl carrier protein